MRRVLLVGWGAVGDTVHAIPAINAIRRSLAPGDEIWFQSVIERHSGVTPHETAAPHLLGPLGLVDRVLHAVVPASRFGIATIEAMVLKALLSRRFDRVLIGMLLRSQPRLLALLDRWTPLACLAVDPISGASPSGDRPLCWHLLESLRYHGIADVTGDSSETPFLDPPAAAVREAEAWLARNRRRPDRRLLAVAPDASYPANRWPVERFVELVHAIEAVGEFEVVLCGGARAAAGCREIAARCPATLVSAGQLSIYGSAALFRRSAVLVGLDTGTTHLASACGVPYVALYGQRGTGRWFFPPCPTGIVLQREVPCKECWLAACNRPGHPCLSGIEVEHVVQAVLHLAHEPCSVRPGT